MALILIVDDEPGIREMLRAVLRADGHRVHVAGSGEDALAVMARDTVDLVITDLAMPGIDGVELLRRGREISADTPAIVITAYGSKESAIEAMRHGAVNYIEKPFDVEEMRLTVRNALGQRRLSEENRRLRERLAGPSELIGTSAPMRIVRDLVDKVAATESTVLITGESGTGKEVVARSIHARSARADKPFVGINCAAIPAELLESELFGHLRGAFTGADRSRRGLVEAAEGGTLFLDEIGDMPPAMQVKLLRVLQERRIRPVGGTEEIPVDVRLITATNRDLGALVADGAFREDLYYRIHVIRIAVPPLRERAGDIPAFVDAFARRHAQRSGRRALDPGPGFLEALARYRWPGNIRELENVVERAVALASDDLLRAETLPPEVLGGAPGPHAGRRPGLPVDLDAYLDEERRRFMEIALEAAGGVQTRAATQLNMTFRSFRYFAKKFGLGGRDQAPEGAREREAQPEVDSELELVP